MFGRKFALELGLLCIGGVYGYEYGLELEGEVMDRDCSCVLMLLTGAEMVCDWFGLNKLSDCEGCV